MSHDVANAMAEATRSPQEECVAGECVDGVKASVTSDANGIKTMCYETGSTACSDHGVTTLCDEHAKESITEGPPGEVAIASSDIAFYILPSSSGIV